MNSAVLGRVALLITCAAGAAGRPEPRYTYHEFDGVYVFYETTKLDAYRRLLPEVFLMTERPLVQAFVADYYKMDARTQPYREAAVFVLAKHEGKDVWHCVTMPVTSDEARRLGVRLLGFPKIMGDVRLERQAPTYTGTLRLRGKPTMTIRIDTKKRVVTPAERTTFDELAGIPMVNLLDGKPLVLGKGRRRISRLRLAELAPRRITLEVGSATVAFAKRPARAANKPVTPYDLTPGTVRLGYYFKNTFPFRLGRGAAK